MSEADTLLPLRLLGRLGIPRWETIRTSSTLINFCFKVTAGSTLSVSGKRNHHDREMSLIVTSWKRFILSKNRKFGMTCYFACVAYPP